MILEEFKKYLIEKYNYNENSNTISAYLSDIKQFINYFKEQFDEDILDFSRANVIEFKKELLEKRNLKYSSVNRKMASLSIYENFLIDKEIRKEAKKIIRDNDFYKITRPYITADMLPRNTIKKVRLKAGTISKRDYALIVLLHEGGLRVSEALNLQLERDIDFEMYSIHILGKGKKIRTIFMKDTIWNQRK